MVSADIILIVAPAFIAYTLAALGHGFYEKSGVLNLAIDGVFVLGIAVAYAVGVYTIPVNAALAPWAGLAAAIAIAILFGLLLTYITTKFPISHGAAGLSIMFLGYGLAPLIGIPARFYYDSLIKSEETTASYTFATSTEVEVLMYIIPIVVAVTLYYILEKTKLGASIKAVGENPHAAAALGVDVMKTRIIATIIGYGLIGAASAMYLTWLPTWDERHGVNHGWLAFAVSLAAGRHPILILPMSALFAGLMTYRYMLQATLHLTADTAKMIPFITAIAAMVAFAATPLRRKLAPPRSLGKIYFKEERTI